METIFVSVASYRDSICSSTIKDLYEKADSPALVFVGICQQNKIGHPEEECITESDIKYKCNVRVMKLNYYEALGPAVARYNCSKLYNNETYYMQIDSHTKFVKGWDTKSKNMIKKLKQTVKKPVLSYYPKMIEESESYDETTVPTICKSFFNERGMISFEGAENLTQTDILTNTPYVTGGFFFCEGYFLNELPYDPNLNFLFVGEEILHSIRFYTNGWDIYSPNENIVFHEYTREGKPKIWTDKSYKDNDAVQKVKYLINLDTNLPPDYLMQNMDKYGLGSERTLEDYYSFAEINVGNKKVYKNFCRPDQILNEELNENKINFNIILILINLVILISLISYILFNL